MMGIVPFEFMNRQAASNAETALRRSTARGGTTPAVIRTQVDALHEETGKQIKGTRNCRVFTSQGSLWVAARLRLCTGAPVPFLPPLLQSEPLSPAPRQHDFGS